MSLLAAPSPYDTMGDDTYHVAAPSPSASSPLTAPPSRQSNESGLGGGGGGGVFTAQLQSTTTPSRSSPAATAAPPSPSMGVSPGTLVGVSNPPTSAELLSLYGPRPVRAQFACDYCRRRKAKCSGTEPCTRCQAKGRECVFTTVRQQRKVTTSLRDIKGERQSQMGRNGKASGSGGSGIGPSRRPIVMSQGSPHYGSGSPHLGGGSPHLGGGAGSGSSSDYGYPRHATSPVRYGPYPHLVPHVPHYHQHSPTMYGSSPSTSASSNMWSSPDSMYTAAGSSPYTPHMQTSPGLPGSTGGRFMPYYEDTIPHSGYPVHHGHTGLGLFFDGSNAPEVHHPPPPHHSQQLPPPPPPPVIANQYAVSQWAPTSGAPATATASTPTTSAGPYSTSAPAITTTSSSPAARPHHLFTPNGPRSASYQDLGTAAGSTSLGFRPPTPPPSL